MKFSLAAFLPFISLTAAAQSDSTTRVAAYHFAPYEQKSVILTCAVGFADQFRTGLNLPSGFENKTVTGYIPIYLRGEYGISKNISVGASFAYDVFNDNYDQLVYGNNSLYRRYFSDNIRIWSAAALGFYHFGRQLHLKNTDLFAGAGLSLNNIRHSSAPQADSGSNIVLNHSVTLYLKAGARFYFSRNTSLFGEVGFDMHSIAAVGVSYRFAKERNKTITYSLPPEPTPAPEPPLVKDTAVVVDTPIAALLPPPHPAIKREPEPVQKIDISTPILFDINKTEIKDASIPVLKEAAQELKETSNGKITIDAYTDMTGSRAHNLTLSLRRANAVKQYLVKLGANPKKIKATGHGINHPVAPNDTPEGRAKNRRVIMRLTGKK